MTITGLSGFATLRTRPSTETKTCRVCGVERPISEFAPTDRWLSNVCRDCDNQRARARRAAVQHRPIYQTRLYTNAELVLRDEWVHVVDDLLPADYAAAFGCSRTKSYDLYHRAPVFTDEQRAVVWQWLEREEEGKGESCKQPQEGRS